MTPEKAWKRVYVAWAIYNGDVRLKRQGTVEFHQLTDQDVKLAAKYAKGNPSRMGILREVRKERAERAKMRGEGIYRAQSGVLVEAALQSEETQAQRDKESIADYGVKWRTTKSGHEIGISPDGKVVKGNPHHPAVQGKDGGGGAAGGERKKRKLTADDHREASEAEHDIEGIGAMQTDQMLDKVSGGTVGSNLIALQMILHKHGGADDVKGEVKAMNKKLREVEKLAGDKGLTRDSRAKKVRKFIQGEVMPLVKKARARLKEGVTMTYSPLHRLVEARQIDTARDRMHEFSVLAGIRPNLPSLEEAAGDLDEGVKVKHLPDGGAKYRVKIGNKTVEVLKGGKTGVLSVTTKVSPSVSFQAIQAVKNYMKMHEGDDLDEAEFGGAVGFRPLNIDVGDRIVVDTTRGKKYFKVMKVAHTHLTVQDAKGKTHSIDSMHGAFRLNMGGKKFDVHPDGLWVSRKGSGKMESMDDLDEAGTPASVKKLAAEVDAYSRKLEKRPEEGFDRLRELAHLLRKLNKFGGAPTTELVQTRRTLRNMMKDGAIPPGQAKHSAANIRAAMEKFRERGMDEDLDEAQGVPALNKWKMHQKGGTTAYAITLHGKKVIVGETPSPKGSGLYRYSLYIDGAKYGKQDFTSTRDLFQTIQKAVVEDADHPFDEAKRPTFKAAKAAILEYLQKEGWKVNPHLKVPHATAPDGQLRLWFKTQAVYYSWGSKHTLGNARSLDQDIRTMTPEEFVKKADQLGREYGKSRHDVRASWDAHWGGM